MVRDLIKRWPTLDFCIGEPATAIQFRALSRLFLLLNNPADVFAFEEVRRDSVFVW